MSQLDRIEEKLDVLTNKVGEVSTSVGRHDERLQVLERDVSRQGDRRWSLLGYVFASVIGAVITKLADSFGHK